MLDVFELTPGELTLEQARFFMQNQPRLVLSPVAYENIQVSAKAVSDIIARKETVYGINTGFGALASIRIEDHELSTLQENLILSHACGTGELLSDDIVSLIILLKVNSLAMGYSGISSETVDALINLYNAGVFPCIPARGSVGASGDLAPLAHLALPLLGVGECRFEGNIISAEQGLAIANLGLRKLAPKEGLALLNGLQASTAILLHAYFETLDLFESAMIAGALSVDAACGSDAPFDSRIHQIRGHSSQARVAETYLHLLNGSEIRDSHRNCDRVQDPYSLRCQPQIMGAVLNQIEFVGNTLNSELNAVTDNPLVFPDNGDVLSGGNFHGEMVAMAADNLSLAIAEIGAASERRIALLVDKHFSQLPAFLVKESGLNSGFMIAHVTAAAAASDNKALAHPHSVDSLSTSANQEDHVSMATNAALRLKPMLENSRTIIAIELLAASQGLEFRKPLKTSPILDKFFKKIRQYVDPYEKDRYFAPDIEIMKELLVQGVFVHVQ